MHVLYSYVMETIYCVFVLLCTQHATIASCEQTVGDKITLLNFTFSFNDSLHNENRRFVLFFPEEISISALSYRTLEKKLKRKLFKWFQNYRKNNSETVSNCFGVQ